ncbi:diguanylate cyclase response regulator [Loktanella sp. D2R18]|uniref:diguanylate cyclase n=1 Tax=Rhodobacterales TaxID=204455 RepID=UPI000DE93D1A|nr:MULTISPECIES: diguanylate cyclase [Rhodobacterales]MDO6589246.1 diguanylate cyclase [Yoonia sp. 1_MG-2023]RBW45558.1 diguanylate cyclase response regulator [Loktanella sp. D2R18]
MPGRILIIDSVATNRIVMKVKMSAAQFRVNTCASRAEADAHILKHRPDLILASFGNPALDLESYCRSLKSNPDTQNITIIAIGVTDSSQARFAALNAGADDVMPRPVNDGLLLARIRSLLRVHSTHQELHLREGTSSALGFEEATTPFETAANVALLSATQQPDGALLAALTHCLGHVVRAMDPDQALRTSKTQPSHALYVIDASAHMTAPARFFGLVSDLRARPDTRQSTQLIVVPDDAPDMAAMFLDLGADDVVIVSASADEIVLRARKLIKRKRLHDRLRDTVRDGLQAAVTDPLTGLFNRRYVDPHLARMAQHAQMSGDAMAVMMVDIDHFKSINDTYGHAAGDKVLKQLAKRIKDNIRAVDMLARVGGEEFLVALPDTTAAQAQMTANRILSLINSTPFDIGEAHPPLPVTISVGVAISRAKQTKNPRAETICAQADAALYAAKSAGRDQVAMAS